MKRNLFTAIAVWALFTGNCAMAKADVFDNPIIRSCYTADPSAHVFGDTLYIYPSHDEDNAVNFSMKDYHVFTTTDMETFQDRGVIFKPFEQTTWAKQNAWAPDCVYRNGKYYLYYPTDKKHIGVAVSDSPTGPFTDPLGHPLLSIDSPGVVCDRDFIDPCVFIDNDGQAYMFVGQNTLCCIKLNEDMISYDGQVHIIEGLVEFFEAAWCHKYKGKYYLSYSNSSLTGHQPEIVYAMSDNPLGPYEYKGVILDPVNSGTNHHSIVQFKNKWYMFYHNADLSISRKQPHTGVRRSVCVDRLYYNPDGTIRKVIQTHKQNDYCASAKTYWCSPDGVSDGSSYNKPGSFAVLVSELAAGDTLYMRGGQYDFDRQINISCSGTADKRIMIIGCPGEKPVLDFRRQPYGKRGLVIVKGADWLHLGGFTVRYAGKNGVHNSGSHNIFERLDVYGNGDSGIQMKAGGDNLILNCDSHDNFDYRLQGDFGGNADGFADKQYTGGGNMYIGCRSWNNSDDGWDFYQRISLPGTETVLIDCICYQNGPYEYDMRGHARYETDREWFDSFSDGQTVMFRNGTVRKVSLEHYYNNGNRNGFKLGGGMTDCNVHLIGCIAVGNCGKGFDQNSNAGNMTLEKCSALANASDFNFYRKECGRLTITDCVTVGGEHRMECLEVHESGNSWNNPERKLETGDFVSLDTTLILLPRHYDGSLQQTGFLTLKESLFH